MGRSRRSKDAYNRALGYNSLPKYSGGSIDLEVLKKMADITGGKMYTAGGLNSLKDILSEINEMEKTDIKVSSRIIYKEKFYSYLLMGVIFLIFSHLSKYFLLKEFV